MAHDEILVLNAGSSSLKFAVFSARDLAAPAVVRGQIEGLAEARARLRARGADGAWIADEAVELDRQRDPWPGIFEYLEAWLRQARERSRLVAVGHRVVHGGAECSAPLLVDAALLARLEALVPLAPLHQPQALAGIRIVRARRPGVAQVACFDTAFHRGRPSVAERFGLPDAWYRRGIRRYGFHGLSYEYVTAKLRELAPQRAAGRVVIAHLGNGASLCAVRAGRSLDTTMSFSALDGVPMGTRCGSLDPGVVLYLLREGGMDLDAVESLLYEQSGLLGISGLTSDMRELVASRALLAREAIDYFVHRIVREIGALAAVLGGLDALVFTAGIGENAPAIRERICRGVAWLGLRLDEEANRSPSGRISVPGATPEAWVIPTDEERMIALHTAAALPETRG